MDYNNIFYYRLCEFGDFRCFSNSSITHNKRDRIWFYSSSSQKQVKHLDFYFTHFFCTYYDRKDNRYFKRLDQRDESFTQWKPECPLQSSFFCKCKILGYNQDSYFPNFCLEYYINDIKFYIL